MEVCHRQVVQSLTAERNLDTLRGISSGPIELILLAGIHDGDAYPSMKR